MTWIICGFKLYVYFYLIWEIDLIVCYSWVVYFVLLIVCVMTFHHHFRKSSESCLGVKVTFYFKLALGSKNTSAKHEDLYLRESINFWHSFSNRVLACPTMLHKKHRLFSLGIPQDWVCPPFTARLFEGLAFPRGHGARPEPVCSQVCSSPYPVLHLREVDPCRLFCQAPVSVVVQLDSATGETEMVVVRDSPPPPRCDSSFSWWPWVQVAPSPPSGPRVLMASCSGWSLGCLTGHLSSQLFHHPCDQLPELKPHCFKYSGGFYFLARPWVIKPYCHSLG